MISSPGRRPGRVRGVAVSLLLGFTTTLPAQGAPRAEGPQGDAPNPAAICWWEGAAALGGVALASAFDEPVQRSTQGARTPGGDRLAAALRRMGQPEVFATIPAVMFVAGMTTTRPTLRRAGERVAASLALAGVLAVAGKFALGRLRPNQAAQPDDWKPFSGADAFPSGHATMAFALATSLADEIRHPWATIGLMTAAAGTGWSRLNDNQHWLSDVVAGAALGIASAQVIEGRWTVFHLHPPAFSLARGQSAVAWRISVRVP